MTDGTLILNRNARRLRQRPELIERLTAAARGRARVHVTEGLAELDAVARDLAAAETRAVTLCGGDGTFMSGLSALARAFDGEPLPPLAFAPAGTVATIARNFQQEMDPVKVVERVCCGAERLPTVERPTLRVVEDEGTTRLGFIVGTGMVARFFDEYYAAGAGGYGCALRIALRLFAGSFVGNAYARKVLDPLPCTLEVDGRSLSPRAFSLILSATVHDVGLHVHVTYRAGEDPGRPHLVASPLPARRLGPQWPRALLGRPLHGEDNFDGTVESFSVNFPSGSGPYVLDGDVFHAARFTVGSGPLVRVLKP